MCLRKLTVWPNHQSYKKGAWAQQVEKNSTTCDTRWGYYYDSINGSFYFLLGFKTLIKVSFSQCISKITNMPLLCHTLAPWKHSHICQQSLFIPRHTTLSGWFWCIIIEKQHALVIHMYWCLVRHYTLVCLLTINFQSNLFEDCFGKEKSLSLYL
jgi:hypothetical protein